MNYYKVTISDNTGSMYLMNKKSLQYLPFKL